MYSRVEALKVLCVCLIVPLENFWLIWRRHHCRVSEGLQILTNAWHSWPMSSEGSLRCHIYCDTGHPFILVISEDSWHSHLIPSAWQLNCHYLFYDLGLSSHAHDKGSNPDLPHARCTLYLYATAAVCMVLIKTSVWKEFSFENRATNALVLIVIMKYMAM